MDLAKAKRSFRPPGGLQKACVRARGRRHVQSAGSHPNIQCYEAPAWTKMSKKRLLKNTYIGKIFMIPGKGKQQANELHYPPINGTKKERILILASPVLILLYAFARDAGRQMQ